MISRSNGAPKNLYCTFVAVGIARNQLFFVFPSVERIIIYTSNAIERLSRIIQKTSKTRGSFPTDDAATKLIYLAIRSFEKADRAVREWVLHGTNSLPYA